MKHDVFYQLKTGKDQQLVCFPYLGGYINSFSELAKALNEKVEVWSANSPGHGGSASTPLQDIHSLVDLYFSELLKIIKSQCIFFGHSMGGVVAYFLAQKIFAADDYPIKPRAIVLSACNTPSYFRNKNISGLVDSDLIKHLMTYGGIPDEILEEKSLLSYFLPVYRADFMILETAALCDYKPLDIPVYFLWGEKDEIVSFDEVLKWSNYFTTEINLFPIENAPHMFVDGKTAVVTKHLDTIFEEMDEICC